MKTIQSTLLTGLNQLNYLSLAGNGVQTVGRGFLWFINETCLQSFYFNSLDQCLIEVNMMKVNGKSCARFNSTTCYIVKEISNKIN